MFIEQISEAAYLQHSLQFTQNVSQYLNQNSPISSITLLVGYVSVEGDYPEGHDIDLIYDPEHDMNFLPIRVGDGWYYRVVFNRNTLKGFEALNVCHLTLDEFSKIKNNELYVGISKHPEWIFIETREY